MRSNPSKPRPRPEAEATNMDHQIKRYGDKIVISLSGRLDQHNAEGLKMPLAMADASRAQQVELDFTNVSYIGSTGIALLVQFYKNIATRGGNMTLLHLNPSIAEMFRTLKLNQLFKLA